MTLEVFLRVFPISRFRPPLRIISMILWTPSLLRLEELFSMTKALWSKLDSCSFHRASSCRRLDLSTSNVRSFCCVVVPSITTRVSQQSRREPNNNKVDTSFSRGISRQTIWLISPWNVLRCSAILQQSWYLSLTSFLNTETLFKAFLVWNILSIFLHNSLLWFHHRNCYINSCLWNIRYMQMSLDAWHPKLMYLCSRVCSYHIVRVATSPCILACPSFWTSNWSSWVRST